MPDASDFLMHTYGRLPVTFVKGRGAVLTDDRGRDYLDFLAGVGVVCLGHCHPALVEALKRQAERLWQASNYFTVEHSTELAEALSGLLSQTTDELGHLAGSTGSVWRTFFCNSGAEANEGAIKVARKWGRERTGATGILSLKRSFHGRTLATLAATGQEPLQAAFRPLPPGFAHVELNDAAALAEALARPDEATGPVCAVLIECIQGEGGVWPADLDYLREVRRLTEEAHALLIVDEVQTGFFRTGAPFAYQAAGIEPDIVSMAKGLGGGFPMGAVAARAEVADVMAPGDHGSTFGGNALACAVGATVVRTLVDEGIGEHVIACGEHLAKVLAGLPHVTEVRGRGLMRGISLDAPVATAAVERGLDEGLVLNHIGDSILRFLPPLVVTEDQVDAMAERLGPLIERLCG